MSISYSWNNHLTRAFFNRFIRCFINYLSEFSAVFGAGSLSGTWDISYQTVNSAESHCVGNINLLVFLAATMMSVLYVYSSQSEHKVKHENMNTINHKYLQYNKLTIYKYYTTTNPIVQV